MRVGDLADRSQPIGTLHLGCPVWSCAQWVGHFLTDDARQRDFLPQYSTVFNTVEGNSTFYALPSLETVQRWTTATTPEFRFSLKFPRVISHDKQLIKAENETARFLEILRILQQAQRLGPSFLQLAPTFSGTHFTQLETYLRWIAREDVPVAVEVRHPDYFDAGSHEQQFDALLRELEMDRVNFDSRALFSATAADPAEAAAQERKPQVPLRRTVTGRHPFVRFVGKNDVDLTEPWLREWCPEVSKWLREGRDVYFFTHTPNDFFAPAMARSLHHLIQQQIPELPSLPAWPHERRAATRSKQKTLF